jgi:molybdenum cofactor cytidylyltransferase
MFAAVILAAGHSSRMGRSKALLPHIDPDATFVGHAIRQARDAGLMTILVIGQAHDDELRREVERQGGHFVVNPDADRGQLSSLLVGLEVAAAQQEVEGLVVMPVDVPLISGSVIRKLLECAARDRASIIRAVHQGRHGHPVLFKRAVFDELRSADWTLGAKVVLRKDPSRVLDVEVEEPGVVTDVDTPADYERLLGRQTD